VRLSATGGENLPVQKLTAAETILHIFPENIASRSLKDRCCKLSSLAFCSAWPSQWCPSTPPPLLALTDSLAATMFKFTNLVMYFAPFGVGAAIAYTVAVQASESC